ncbi:hypothetical protein ACRXCV_09865 [Halobacteriovorax sp. GFR7]|uniref:hypothetical protein n=1 Tax=unclassified Halobacteriovorax TaxID=2639665 RepID=UPI003D994B93
MKKLRNYRIKLKESDNIECILYEMIGDSTSNSFNVAVDNISTTGIGVLIGEYVDSQIFKIEIKFKKIRLFQTVKLRRYRPNFNNAGDNYLGLEFIDYEVESIMNLMTELVSSMGKRRLRNLMYDMVLNEAVAGNYDSDNTFDKDIDDNVSVSMILDLFHIFKNYRNKVELIKLFIIEVQRIVKARDARAFIVGHDEHTFSEFDFHTNQLKEIEYPIVGILEELYNNPRGIKSKFSQSLSSDEFFNMYEVVNNTTISTYMMCPIFDHNENIFGILNFSNKEKNELFTDNDLKQAMFLARVIGLLYFYKSDEIDEYEEYNNGDYGDDFDTDVAFNTSMGISVFAKGAQAFLDQYSAPNEKGPVYIYGGEGSGKYYLCEKIARQSNTANTHIEVVNCYAKMTKKDIDEVVDKIRDRVINGHVIFKGLDKLSPRVANYIIETVDSRESFRILFTGTVYLNDLTIPSFKTISLVERKEDILFFANYFISQYSLKNHTTKKRLSHRVQKMLLDYDWPGNISELKACIARLMIFNKGSGNLTIRTSEITPLFERDIQPQISIEANDLKINAFDEHDLNEQECADLYLYFFVAKQLKEGAVGLKSVAKGSLIDYEDMVGRLKNGSKVVKRLFNETVERVELYISDNVA